MCSYEEMGIGHGRLGFAGHWGIASEKAAGWSYQEVLQNPNAEGIYLYP